MSIKIKIDAAAIASQFKDMKANIERDIQQGVKTLATISHAKIAEMAHSELHSTQKKYLDALHIESLSENIHVISLDESAIWIEEGIDPDTDMKPGLLKNGKVSKAGNNYKVIPFEHSKPSSEQTSSQQELTSQIKTTLAKNKVSLNKIEYNPNGSPKLGKLHTFNIKSDIPGKGNTPALHGVNVFQSKDKSGKVRRDVLTFRTVTSGSASVGKWIHPGTKKMEFFEKCETWATQQWENVILPEILKKYS